MIGADDAALVARDPELAGLGLLLDEERFAERLARAVPAAGVRAARAHYLRYKPATSCPVAYRVELDGATWDVHAVAWRDAETSRLEKASTRGLAPGPLGPGLLRWPDVPAAVWSFPNDLSVRALRRLGTEADRRRLLERLARHRPELHGGAVVPLAYKPARRFVGRVEGEGACAVLKLYTRWSYALRANAERAFGGLASVATSRALGRTVRNRAVLLDWLAGEPLGDRLRRGEAALGELEAAGAALAALHAARADGLALRPPAATLDALGEIAGALGRLVPERASAIGALADGVAAALDARVEVPVHGDLHAKQILVGGERVGFLDLDRAALGTRAQDLGNFAAHLQRDEALGRLPRGSADEAIEAFFSGYVRGGGRCPPPGELDLERATALLRVAMHPFRNRESDWRARVERLLDLAEQALSAARAAPRAAPVGRGATSRAAPTSLDVALARLAAEHGVEPRAVSRVEPVSRPGGGLQLTAESEAGARWFRFGGGRLAELRPEDDLDLPLARSLAGSIVLAYRPGRRLVLELAKEGAIEKGYRSDRFARAAARHELAAALSPAAAGFELARPVERRAESASLRLRRLAGAPLQLAPATVERFGAVGCALRALQDAGNGGAGALSRHGVDEELANLARWRARVERAAGEPAAPWELAHRDLVRRARSLPAAPAVWAHRDLHDGQILDDGERLALVDFDSLARADAALDAGNLLAHLELRRRQGFADAATADSAGRAFRAGLGRDDEPDFAERLAFYRAAALLRLALVYRLRPRWWHLAPALVEEGRRWSRAV